MTSRVGINGFGRMGRLAMRAGWDRPGLRFTQINETATDAAGSAHLLQFDSVHGTWDRACASDDASVLVDGNALAHSSNPALADTIDTRIDLLRRQWALPADVELAPLATEENR